MTVADRKLQETCDRLERIEAEVVAGAKSEEEALEIYLRHGIDERNAAIFAGMHGEYLAKLAKRAPAGQAA